jgi:hypothetical protein
MYVTRIYFNNDPGCEYFTCSFHISRDSPFVHIKEGYLQHMKY